MTNGMSTSKKNSFKNAFKDLGEDVAWLMRVIFVILRWEKIGTASFLSNEFFLWEFHDLAFVMGDILN